MDKKQLIVAVDFDGILCESKFPEIGLPIYEMVSFVRQMQDAGVETILWTSRVDDKLAEAVRWCEDRGLHFTSVNGGAPSNLDEFGTDPRKVMAHIYIDDNTPWFRRHAYRINYNDVIKAVIEDTKWFLKSEGVQI